VDVGLEEVRTLANFFEFDEGEVEDLHYSDWEELATSKRLRSLPSNRSVDREAKYMRSVFSLCKTASENEV